MAAVAAPPSNRKKLVRRAGRDFSQVVRRSVQLAFLALNVWIAAEFFLFVRYYETGGRTVWAARPAGVEGWLPIASLMNFKVWLYTGELPALHPAGMFLLAAFLRPPGSSARASAGGCVRWAPISEYLWRLGRQTFGRTFRLPRKLDLGLRSLKYILLGLFLYAVGSMTVPAIRAFLGGPYGVVADVKMLNFFRYLGLTGGVVLAVLVIGSVFVQNLWCRYLCPYGALMGLASMASPIGIRRDPDLCIDCGKCAKACPSALPVDRLITIKSAECIGCMECVTECPAAGALFLAAPGRRRVPAWVVAAGVAAIFFGAVGYAQWSGHWRTDLPSRVYFELIPRANEFTHP